MTMLLAVEFYLQTVSQCQPSPIVVRHSVDDSTCWRTNLSIPNAIILYPAVDAW